VNGSGEPGGSGGGNAGAPVRVRLAALLHSYTGGRDVLDAEGATVGDVMDDLDRRFPGLAFRVIDEQGRVRRHVNLFVGRDAAPDRAAPVPPGTEIYIVGALSGG
jgi:molybdopterin synthase sulfur carrier subunit